MLYLIESFSFASVAGTFKSESNLCLTNEVVIAGCYLRNSKLISICNIGQGDEFAYRYGNKNHIIFEHISNVDDNDGFYFTNNSGGSVSSYSIFLKLDEMKYRFANANNSMTFSIYDEKKGEIVSLERCKPDFLMNDEESKIYSKSIIFPDSDEIRTLFKEEE